MADKTADQIKAEEEAAAKAAAEKAKADEAREALRIAEKAKADNPHLHDPDYTGPITGQQALARLDKFGPLGGRETKPATAETKPVGSETKSR
jgi:hypothetical protein